MHNHLPDSTICKGNSSKRSASLLRREVLFEPSKKSKSRPSSSSSSPSILTSSRRNSGTLDNGPSNSGKVFTQIPAAQFYATSKPFLEKQYEKHLKKFVPTDTSDYDFVPLESNPDAGISPKDESILKTSEEEADTGILAGQEVIPLQIEDLMTNSNQSIEMQIAILLHSSEMFLTKAHSLVLECNDMAGTLSYYSYIKLGMKCLYMVVKDYRAMLSPVLETTIYHKLAMIYLEETECLDQAEIYTVSAISMASRHNLIKLKVMSELLYCHILELRQANSVSSYYVERQTSYLEIGYKPIADLFLWARIGNMLVNDVVSGARALRTTNLRDDVCPTLRFLFLLREVALNLYQNVSFSSTLLTTRAQEVLKKTQLPLQLQANLDILMLAACAIKNDVAAGKLILRKISHFIHTQRKVDWEGWEEDGSILVRIPLSDNLPESIKIKLHWVNPYEFSILFYFFSGVLQASSLESFKETKRIFEKCLSMLDCQLKELTSTLNSRRFSIQYLTKNMVRLTFIRYSVIFYTVYMDFMHKNDFSGLFLIKNFISCFHSDYFTQEELCYYKILIPKFLYLAALGYHSLGDLVAAKYYYYRVRFLTSSTPAEKDYYISALQKQVGLGWDAASSVGISSELYLYSTVHLLALLNREIHAYFKLQEKNTEKAYTIELSNLSNVLSADLEKAFSEHHERLNAGGPLQLLKLSHQLISTEVSTNNNGKFLQSYSGENLEQICKQCKVEGYLKALTTYVIYKVSTDQKKRARMLVELAKIGSSHDDGARLVGISALSEEKLRETSNGNHSRASKIEARICHLRKNLDLKLRLLELCLSR